MQIPHCDPHRDGMTWIFIGPPRWTTARPLQVARAIGINRNWPTAKPLMGGWSTRRNRGSSSAVYKYFFCVNRRDGSCNQLHHRVEAVAAPPRQLREHPAHGINARRDPPHRLRAAGEDWGTQRR
jgi:hypothetical protein